MANQQFDDLDRMYQDFTKVDPATGKSKKQELEDAVKDAEKEVKRLMNEISDLDKQIKTHQDEMKKMIDDGKTGDPDFSQHQNEVATLMKERDSQKAELKTKKRDLLDVQQDLKDALDDMQKAEQSAIGNNQEAQDYLEIALAKKYDRAVRDAEKNKQISLGRVSNLDELTTIMENDNAYCKTNGDSNSIEQAVIEAMKAYREIQLEKPSVIEEIERLQKEIEEYKKAIEGYKKDLDALDPADPDYSSKKQSIETNKKAYEIGLDGDEKNLAKLILKRKNSDAKNAEARKLIEKRTGGARVFSYEEMSVMIEELVNASLKPVIDSATKKAAKDQDGHTIYEDQISVDHILPQHDSDYSAPLSRARNNVQRAANDLAKKEEILQGALLDMIQKHPNVPFDPKSDFMKQQLGALPQQQIHAQYQQQNAQLQQQYDQLQQQIQQQAANATPNFTPNARLKNLAAAVLQARQARDNAQSNLPAVQPKWYQFIQRGRQRRARNEARRAENEYNRLQAQANQEFGTALAQGTTVNFADPNVLAQIANANIPGNNAPAQQIHIETQAEAQQRQANQQQLQNIQNQQAQLLQQSLQQAQQAQVNQPRLHGREPGLTDFQKRVKVSPYIQAKLDKMYREGYKKSKQDIKAQSQQQQQQQQQQPNGPTR